MTSLLSSILIIAYAFTGIVATIGYLPTIRDLHAHKKMSANIHSYIIWTICGGISFFYGLFILPDTLFIIVSGLSFASCAIILCLSVILSYHK